MTNAEKYLKDGVDVKKFAEMIDTAYVKTDLDVDVCESTINWLEEQAKPTLTKDERVILRNIGKEYLTITREDDGDILIWTELGSNTMLPYDHLFQFIKERRRI